MYFTKDKGGGKMKRSVILILLFVISLSLFTQVAAQQVSNSSRSIDITGIEYIGNNQIKIVGRGKLDYTYGRLNDNRLYFDIKNANLIGRRTEIIPQDSNNIRKIVYSQNNTNPMIVRVVFELTEASKFNISNDNNTMIINIEKGSSQAQVAATPAAAEVKASPAPAAVPQANNGRRTVVIDPGHGGVDPGAIANGRQEKVINLQIGLKLENRLRSLGYNVLMTRNSDNSLRLADRTAYANRVGGHVFVSIHANSFPFSSAKGVNTFYSNGSSNGRRLASLIQNGVVNNTGASNRGIGVHWSGLHVVDKTIMPAVLVEVGFLSNLAEGDRLANDGYQNQIVDGMVEGINKYFN